MIYSNYCPTIHFFPVLHFKSPGFVPYLCCKCENLIWSRLKNKVHKFWKMADKHAEFLPQGTVYYFRPFELSGYKFFQLFVACCLGWWLNFVAEKFQLRSAKVISKSGSNKQKNQLTLNILCQNLALLYQIIQHLKQNAIIKSFRFLL